jgi:site-specific DNA-adenine methylase
MSFRLVETCCGSAALSLHLLGARRPLLPYQGGKWRFRHSLKTLLSSLAFEGCPTEITLFDPGPWGTVMGVILDPPRRCRVIDQLTILTRLDARSVYDDLHGKGVPEDEITFTTEYLFLQRLSFSGKAVGIRDGNWSSPGFNTSSAYGLPGTERFGPVKPMIPSLIRVLTGYGTSLGADVEIRSNRSGAGGPDAINERTLVYIDPPYRGTTAYPNGTLSRDDVVALALKWRDAGAAVMVSEAEALPALVDAGWEKTQLYAGRSDTSPFRGKQAEWVTYGAEARQRGPEQLLLPGL